MTIKTWSNFLKDVLVHVTGCPEPVAEFALLRAAQNFFEATHLWTEWLPDLTTDGQCTVFGLALESKSELVRLERAVLDGRPIDVRTEEMLPADWRQNPQCLRTGVHTPDRKTIVLLPVATPDLALSVQASMKPANSATGIEQNLFDQYVREIAAGAIADLKGHAEKSYSDPNGAILWQGRFNSYKFAADFQRFRGHSSARPRRRASTF